MASFRSPKEQSRHVVIKKTKHGASRHIAKANGTEDDYVHGIGTEETYKARLTIFIKWLHDNHLGVHNSTAKDANAFLESLQFVSKQKTIDGHREAIIKILGIRPKRVMSQLCTILLPRAYTKEQITVLCIASATTKLSLPIRIASHAGLRAHELDTLARADEMKEDNRDWLDERFDGREKEVMYVVKGKGGLIRAVGLPSDIAIDLELSRLDKTTIKRERGINYLKRYSIIGGQSFSEQFSNLSLAEFGWSTGAHGLRHHFAQQRMRQLQKMGYIWGDALKILSQELGHFSKANTLTYMR